MFSSSFPPSSLVIVHFSSTRNSTSFIHSTARTHPRKWVCHTRISASPPMLMCPSITVSNTVSMAVRPDFICVQIQRLGYCLQQITPPAVGPTFTLTHRSIQRAAISEVVHDLCLDEVIIRSLQMNWSLLFDGFCFLVSRHSARTTTCW